MKEYDLVIIGAGISGSALLYLVSKYTNIQRIALIEKYGAPALVNTSPIHNSQTIHCGDIETNYSLEKALKVCQAANMLKRYARAQPEKDRLIFRLPKMVLGVGHDECEFLRERYKEFGQHFSHLMLLEKEGIEKLAPAVMQGRPFYEEVVALGSINEYSAVNFAELSRSFMNRAHEEANKSGKEIDIFYDEKVKRIRKLFSFWIDTETTTYHARSVVSCAGGHSLQLAHQMGRGLDLSVVPIAGSYFYTHKGLGAKVYTIQDDDLPFAAVHGDPDIAKPWLTRFGPTALLLPMFERGNYKTILDFARTVGFNVKAFATWWKLFKVKKLRNYLLKNLLYEVPLLRKRLFIKDVRKIVPSINVKDLKRATGYGGVRPQLIDLNKRELKLGEAKIDEGDGCIFNVTPSPGGTSCLLNAEQDMRAIVDFLELTVDNKQLAEDLHNDPN